MARYSLGLLLAVILLVGASWPSVAFSAWVWQQAGPVGSTDGLTAIAIDPDDPQLVYFAAGSTIWISDDGGDTFRIVANHGRSLRRRAVTESDETEADDDEFSEEAYDDPAPLDQRFDLSGFPGSNVEDQPAEKSRRRKDKVAAVAARLPSISRLRLLGDRVYVCGARGVSSFERSARSLTLTRAEWMGKKEPVFDVIGRAGGGLWVATAEGLQEVTPDGSARSVPGQLGQEIVTRILSAPHLLVASESGIWTGTPSGFIRRAILPRRRIIRDMALDRSDLWLLTQDQLLRFDLARMSLQEVISVAGGRRLTFGREGKLWIATDSGVWKLGAGSSLSPIRAGLRDANFNDIAATSDGPYPLWVVGRGGAWRLTTEVERVLSARAREMKAAMEGFPTAFEVLERAQWARRVHPDQVGDWRKRLATAWMLPQVRLTYIPIRRRIEWRSLLPSLGSHVIDEVRILPVDDEFRLIANWEVLPALFALLGRGGLDSVDIFNEQVKRSYRDVERIRRRVTPIYGAWLKAAIQFRTSRPANLRQAATARLALEQLSADLHALTGGWFGQYVEFEKGDRP
jgi:hypothetical protein